MAGVITYQVEDFRTAWPGIEPLLAAHWHELALDHDAVPLDPDPAGYQALEDAGKLHIVTVRVDGEVAGYHASIVGPHLHYRSTLFAVTDVFFLRPDLRRGTAGTKLLREAERTLKARGVRKAIMSHKAHFDLSALFGRLGWRLSDLTYVKVL